MTTNRISVQAWRSLALAVALVVAFVLVPAGPTHAAVVPPVVTETLHGLPPAERSTATGDATARVTSRAVRTPIAFSMVGFTAPEDAVIAFRSSRDGRNWSLWQTLHAHTDEGPDATSAELEAARSVGAANRASTPPLWVGEGSWIQTRVAEDAVHGSEASTGGDVSSEDVAVHLIDTDGLNRGVAGRIADSLAAAWRGSARGPAATAAARRPPMVSRAGWGADESLRRHPPSYASRIEAGAVHHTVGSNDYSREQAPGIVRGIYAYHTQSLKWSDIGYNFLVDRFGTVYEGRYGGVDRAVIGAHAGGFNTATFGVSLMGTFTSAAPSTAGQRSVARLAAWKFRLAKVRPTGTVVLTSAGSTRYPAGTRVRLPRLMGHRDVSLTACPGDQTYQLLPRLRRRTAEMMSTWRSLPEGLLYARSSERSNPRQLRWEHIKGQRYVWWNHRRSKVARTAFWLDNRRLSGAPDRVDRRAPFDLGLVNTGRLRNGRHWITTRVAFRGGRAKVVHTPFTVANPPPPPDEPTWATRINAGGGRFIARDGTRWAPDRSFQGGKTFVDSDARIGGPLQILYRSERFGMSAYRLDVPQPGIYEVKLRLAEIFYGQPGQRVFDVVAEDRDTLSALDIVARVGPRRPYNPRFRLAVTDGRLDLEFRVGTDLPKLSALEVRSVAPVLLAAQYGAGSTAEPLHDATVRGDVDVLMPWPNASHTTRAEFWIDDRTRSGRAFATDDEPPYRTGTIDTSLLRNGRHVITTMVHLTEGGPIVTHTGFNVANG